MSKDDAKKVLVVDDEEDVRDYLTMALMDAGFKVETASDGVEAMDLIKKSPPDLISLDLVMPRKSGVKLYRELAKNPEWSNIPVLVVTGHARDDLGRSDLNELTMSGPGVYLEKPVKPTNYIAAVKKLLKMEITTDERKGIEQTRLQSELKDFIEEADPETLEELKRMMKKRKG